MEKLTIKGGYPVRESKLYYGRQWIDEDDVKAVSDVLRSSFITCGPMVDKIEQSLCDYTGAKHAVVVSNGTAALHCACIAAGVYSRWRIYVFAISHIEDVSMAELFC